MNRVLSADTPEADPGRHTTHEVRNQAKPRMQLDVSLDFKLSKRLSLYANVRNLTNEIQKEDAYGSETPHYAREFYHGKFGRPFTLGVKGSF